MQQQERKILWDFYNYVLDECGGDLHEYQIEDFIENKKSKGQETNIPLSDNLPRAQMSVQQIISVINAMAYDAVIAGLQNPLEVYIALKAIEKTLETALKSVNDSAINEARKYGKSFDQFNAHIDIRSNPGKWKYEHIEKWNDFKGMLKSCEEGAKEAYYAQKKGESIVNTITGEVSEPAYYEEGRENIFIKLK